MIAYDYTQYSARCEIKLFFFYYEQFVTSITITYVVLVTGCIRRQCLMMTLWSLLCQK